MKRKRYTGITGKLNVGDVVIVHNPLLTKECSRYMVEKIEGNKAFTGFRIFNRNIYHGKTVYEFGKRQNPIYSNSYEVETQTP